MKFESKRMIHLDNIEEIKASRISDLIAQSNWVTLDVRDSKERSAGFLVGLHVPLNELSEQLENIPSDKNLLVYCRCGNRSITAIEQLQAAGFKQEMLSLEGGIMSVHKEVAKSGNQILKF